MEEALHLSQEQRLQQRLSPLQVRFGKLLEMSGPEVEDEVRQAIDENPALERVDDAESLDEGGMDESFDESAEELRMADYADADDIPSYRLEAHNHSSDSRYFEPTATAHADTLYDVLSAQLADHELTPHERHTALYVIGNLDDNGYLTRSAAAMATDIEEQTDTEVTPAEVRKMIDLIKTMEPVGVGAVDLRECLLLQLRRRESTPAVKLAIDVVTHYFDLFSLKHYERISAATGATAADLRQALDTIRTLDPKPASGLTDNVDAERTRHIVPDFVVELTDRGQLQMELLNTVPELRVEATFAADGTAASRRWGREAALFVKRRRDEATEFIELLRKRQSTLMSVMSAIVEIQHEFFLSGDEKAKLRPMILKDVAALTDLDLSVISRATAGKYVATNNGVYPLKFFFNERPMDGDSDTSSHEILAALRQIIGGEDKSHPLSDEAITTAINERGYGLARRTVSKYREKLGIPVARLRREV